MKGFLKEITTIDSDGKQVTKMRELSTDEVEELVSKLDNEADDWVILFNRIKNTLKRFSLKRIVYTIRYTDMGKRIKRALLVALFAVLMYVDTYYISDIVDFNESAENAMTNTTSSVIDVFVNDNNELEVNVEKASICNAEGKYTELNDFSFLSDDIECIDNSYTVDGKNINIGNKTKLKSLLVSNTMFYGQYTNEENTGAKEILLCYDVPKEIDLSNIDRKSLRFFESSNPISIKSYINSFNDSVLMMTEYIGGSQLAVQSNKEYIDKAEQKMKCADKTDGIILNINDFGTINISNITELGNKATIEYSSEDKVLRVKNSDTDDDVIYLFNVNNEKVGCSASDFLKTNVENLFIHKGYDKEDSVGYKTLAFVVNNSIYCIKFNGEKSEEVKKEVFEQLGISNEQLLIDTIQEVIIEEGN